MKAWETRTLLSYCLIPFSWLYRLYALLRQRCYQWGFLKVHTFPLPVVVVGSLYIGGVGKTPFVIALANLLKKNGFKPAIVSRGYRGRSPHYPLSVTTETSVKWSGDEPYLMARATSCPVIVAPNRPKAVSHAIEHFSPDIILSDDGLTHYALGRTVEYALFPPKMRGNGFYFPAGCLRGPINKYLQKGRAALEGFDYMTVPKAFVSLSDATQVIPLDSFAQKPADALAGIADPSRFFKMLSQLSIQVTPHVFPDHHPFTSNDFSFSSDKPIIMTEKDAVKCADLGLKNAWYLQIETVFSEEFQASFLQRVGG